jgi:hypothetical protein
MSIDLFRLMPAVYRLRDAEIAASQQLLTPQEQAELNNLKVKAPPLSADEQALLESLLAKASRGPLASLLMLIQEQIGVLAEDLDQLYDDQFIETCAPWVIPYIGDLIGYQSVHGIAPAVDNPRAAVAETISLRRRKGTILVMEQLARDVTGWGAHAVEFFRVLADTQYLNHVRSRNYYAPDLREWPVGLYIGTGFDRTAHKVDVRRIASGRGRYNIQNIGIFLWSMNAYGITHADATPSAADPLAFRFHSLGMDMHLFHRAVSQGEQITTPATPVNVADRLLRRVLCADLQKGVSAEYYGASNSLALYLDGQPVNPYQIRIADLSGADGSWINRPTADTPYAVTVDPELGRIALTPPAPGSSVPKLTTSYFYGFNADMGGGEYARSATFAVQDPAWVFPFPDTAGPPRYNTLQEALNFAVSQLAHNGQVAIEIQGSETYKQAAGLSAALPAGKTLELRAADAARPTLLLNGEVSVNGAPSSAFLLNGLLIAALPSMTPASPSPIALVHIAKLEPDGSSNALGSLSIAHCTLVPGWSVDTSGEPHFGGTPSLVVQASGIQVTMEKSISGAILASPLTTVCACDTILDATDRANVAYAAPDGASGGGALTLQGCTVVGKVHAALLTLISNSIFWGGLAAGDSWATPLVADRRQEGCVRFSFLPEGAQTPRRFECIEQKPASLQPLFFALRYGLPGYAKLLASTPDAIRRGADDGGEMGAFHFVLGPLRETDLRVRMREYLPAGLEFGVIYQN